MHRLLEVEEDCLTSTIPPPTVSDSINLGRGLAIQGARMRFRRNEEIFGEGEPAEHICRVISGTVRISRFTSDGRRQILAFHYPGDVFGLEPGAHYSLSAEAVTDAEISMIRRSLVETAAAQDASAAHALIDLMSRQLTYAREHALVLGRKGANERLAAFLLQLSERLRANGVISLPMPRSDIADYLALTIETVSRSFTQMERDHTIDLPSSRRVVVRDRSALEHLQAA